MDNKLHKRSENRSERDVTVDVVTQCDAIYCFVLHAAATGYHLSEVFDSIVTVLTHDLESVSPTVGDIVVKVIKLKI